MSGSFAILLPALSITLLILSVPSHVFAEKLDVASLDYDITGSSVLSAEASETINSLVLVLDEQGEGVLSITIPREFFDAKIVGVDDEFFVLVDGQETVFGETTTATDRTLRIAFEQGTGEIEIIGTQIDISALIREPPIQPPISEVDVTEDGGGCLIATAAFGTELSPQVQILREVRDNKVIGTQYGAGFVSTFNAFYYSFSPTVADWERHNPVFKDTVKIAITPMLSTLTILQHVDIDSEQEILGYGIGIILLNVGMYFAIPAAIILKLKSKLAK